jgi:hypothetical protein
LALLRSGTCEQSLSFVVFREEPAAEWVRQLGARRVAIDPDRLAFEVSPVAHLNVFVGFPTNLRNSSDRHPLLRVLRTAAASRLVAVEVQLPVPPPTTARTELRWARVRIAVPEGSVPSLNPLFAALGGLAPSGDETPWSLMIRTSPGGSPVWLHGAPGDACAAENPDRVLACSDLDVIQPYLDGAPAERSRLRRPRPAADRREWRILALTADGQLGIESRILDHLARSRPHLQIVGLTTALLHGVSILFLLAYQPGGQGGKGGKGGKGHAGDQGDHGPTSERLEHEFRADQLTVHADSWQTARSLGTPPGPGDRPLLRVQTRSREARGSIATTVRALSAALVSVMGEDVRPEPVLDVWYVLVRVVEGRTASSLMTVRVPEEITAALAGDDYRYRQAMETAQREVRHALSRVAGRQAPGPGDADPDGGNGARYARDDTVVHLETITLAAAEGGTAGRRERRPGEQEDDGKVTAPGAATSAARASRPHADRRSGAPRRTPPPG